MAAFVFDASAIVKRYVQEIGTGWVQALTDPAAGHEIFPTHLTSLVIWTCLPRPLEVDK
jgi:uncharacterized protein